MPQMIKFTVKSIKLFIVVLAVYLFTRLQYQKGCLNLQSEHRVDERYATTKIGL